MMAQGGVLFKFILVLYKFILLMGQGGVLFKFILALYKFILLKGRAFSQHEVLFDWDIHDFYIQYHSGIQFCFLSFRYSVIFFF